jgi:hypothetical protein
VSVGVAAILLVLVVLVAGAVASFFQHMLTALIVLGAILLGLVLHPLAGTTYTVFAIVLVVIFGALVHTVVDTLRLLRTAKQPERMSPPAMAERRRRARREDRSRIAA